jgi:hypothetical protein
MTIIGHPATVMASHQALDGSIQNFIANPEPNSVWLTTLDTLRTYAAQRSGEPGCSR